jgi:methylmalonyl-CoA/ethylmalonyl-CoA epimerase
MPYCISASQDIEYFPPPSTQRTPPCQPPREGGEPGDTIDGMATPETSLQLGRIGQIALTVRDIETSVAFYRDALGMCFLFQVPNLAFFDCDGIRLMLTRPEKAGETAGSVIYFKVPNIQQAFAALSSRGVVFEDEPHLIAKMPDHDLWMTFFRDPDRNLLGLMSEVRA